MTIELAKAKESVNIHLWCLEWVHGNKRLDNAELVGENKILALNLDLGSKVHIKVHIRIHSKLQVPLKKRR